jgi:hypothetical protein
LPENINNTSKRSSNDGTVEDRVSHKAYVNLLIEETTYKNKDAKDRNHPY